MNIPFRNANQFSDLVLSYWENQTPGIDFVTAPFTIESFKDQIEYRKEQFSNEQRQLLVEVLEKQYNGSKLTPKVEANLALLKSPKTFTITTGHQLNIFTGPLYFFYKILSVINTCDRLKQEYVEYNFVPLFWMATEDHDFEEISKVKVFSHELAWEQDQNGGVGRMNPYGLKKALTVLQEVVQNEEKGEELIKLFQKAYLEHKTLSEAHRYIVNQLFASYGLIVLDADDQQLKASVNDIFQAEIEHEVAFNQVTKTNEDLKSKGLKIQVNPREVNLFYLKDNQRDLIMKEGDSYILKGGSSAKSKAELLDLLDKNPERFSPNVLLRPVYQEHILPNLSYCGGAGEIAYWMQLKSTFEGFGMRMPLLMLRNSVVLHDENVLDKMSQFDIQIDDLFKGLDHWNKKFVVEDGGDEISIENELNALQASFDEIKQKALSIDPSISQSLEADQQKLSKLLKGVEQKMVKAGKRGAEKELKKIKQLHKQLFPDGGLQERKHNFIQYYLKYGIEMIDTIQQEIDVFNNEINWIKL